MKLILAAALTLAATPAAAVTCGSRTAILELIEGPKYEESLRARGLASETHLLELFTNEETGTWTVLYTLPNGISCHMASGQNWIEYEKGTNL